MSQASNIVNRLEVKLLRKAEARAKSAADLVRRIVNAESAVLFRWIADHVINKPLSGLPAAILRSDTWAPLSDATVKQKGHQRFFYKTGALQSGFRAMDATTVFGRASVHRKQTGRSITLDIRPYSRLTSISRDGSLEKMLPASTEADKLYAQLLGRKKKPAVPYRPMIPPAMEYFITRVIKSKVREQLKARGLIPRR